MFRCCYLECQTRHNDVAIRSDYWQITDNDVTLSVNHSTYKQISTSYSMHHHLVTVHVKH